MTWWREEPYSSVLDICARSARIAEKVRSVFRGNSWKKQDRTPVTVADYAVQIFFGYHFSSLFPDIPLVGEETAELLKRPEGSELFHQIEHILRSELSFSHREDLLTYLGRSQKDTLDVHREFWTLDPIDGTKGFMTNANYVIALAHIVSGKVNFSCVCAPLLKLPDREELGFMAFARSGSGAFILPLSQFKKTKTIEPTALKVSDQANCQELTFLMSFDTKHGHFEKMYAVLEHLQVVREPIRMHSQAKYILVAGGYGEVYLRIPPPDWIENIWDHAPGSLLIAESGGKVTDLYGRPLDFSTGTRLTANTGILATNGPCHETLLPVIQSVL